MLLPAYNTEAFGRATEHEEPCIGECNKVEERMPSQPQQRVLWLFASNSSQEGTRLR